MGKGVSIAVAFRFVKEYLSFELHFAMKETLMPITQNDIQEMIQTIRDRIVERFHPEKIILFGSHARGDAGPDSDLDILVVMEVEGLQRQKANEIDLALADRIVPMDIIVVTQEQFERRKDLIGTIMYDASREGRILYERRA